MKLKSLYIYIAIFMMFMFISCSTFFMVKSQSEDPIVYDVIVDQDIAYVSYGTAGLHIVDVSNKNDPFLISVYDHPGEIVDAFLLDQLIFALFSNSSLRIIDVIDVGNPTLVGYENLPYPTYNVVVNNNLVYVAAGEYGLKIINATDFSSISIMETYDSIGEVKDVKIKDDLIYLADGSNGFLILNNSNPLNPTLISRLDTGYCENIFVGDFYTYLACGSNGLNIVDVTNSSDPYSVGSYWTSNKISSVVVEFNDLAFVADGVGGLKIIDVGTPAITVMMGYVETTSITRTVFVSDNFAYVANTYELLIVDVSMPALPDVRGSYVFEGGPIVTPQNLLETLTILLIIISIISGIALIVFLAKLGPFIRLTKAWKEDTGPFTNSLAISLYSAISGLFLWLSYNAFINYNNPQMYGMMFTSSLLGGLFCGIFVYKKDWAAVTLPLALLLGICDFCILLLLYKITFVSSFFTSIGILLTTLISSAIGRAINQAIRDEKEVKTVSSSVRDINCSKCGENIPSSSKFCFNCGSTLEN